MSSWKLSAAAAAALLLSAAAVFAQDTTVTGSVSITPEIREYVTKESIPSIKIEKQVVVGEALPDTVELKTIPNTETYAYAVVNDQRVIVTKTDRKVVEIVK